MITLFTIVGAAVCYTFALFLAVAVVGVFVVGLITLFGKDTK